MTEQMRERKKRYVERAMDYLDCEYLCIHDEAGVADICSELGIEVPSGKSVEFRYYRYGCGSTEGKPMMLRVDYKDTYYPVTDAMLDEAFFHYAQLIPDRVIQSIIEHDARNRSRTLLSEITKHKQDYRLDKF